MNTVNIISYPKVQAIKSTDNMKSKQKDFNRKRNQGVAIILVGVALGAAIHVSIGVVMVVIGFMRIPRIASPVDTSASPYSFNHSNFVKASHGIEPQKSHYGF